MNSTPPAVKDESVGHYWSQAAKEREAMERHDAKHPGDPTQWWQDCEECAERVQMDIDERLRCKHGIKGNCGPCEVAAQGEFDRQQEMEIDQSIDADMEHSRHGL